jgi:hypothetical protein
VSGYGNARACANDDAVDDPEMSAIFAADQADRGVNRKTKSAYVINWSVVSRADKKRRLAVRKIMTAGRLGTAKDFERAAYVFQHGQDPDDYLLAHVLAVVAVEKGDKDATWVSAATLDRYLGAIGRKQIFGTQFFISKDAKVTQEPYDRGLISDSLRASSHVIPIRAGKNTIEDGRVGEGCEWRVTGLTRFFVVLRPATVVT